MLHSLEIVRGTFRSHEHLVALAALIASHEREIDHMQLRLMQLGQRIAGAAVA
jgi:hypothetical protein